MEQGVDLVGRLARIGYGVLSSKYCCEESPSLIALAHFTSLCVVEFGLDMEEQQVLTNLMVDSYIGSGVDI